MTTTQTHEVLAGAPGTTACMLGNVAIVRGALEAGLQFFTCYPGTPSSEVGDTIARIAKVAGILFDYSVNEKIAVETAFAASLTGARSMCAMKHLGVSYASDPISTMPYVGVEGGMVIVSAGDPSAITSPNEQDQRHLSRFLFYPIFDPATPDDALKMTRFAFGFSEATRLPVIMRTTTRVCHVSGIVELGPLPEEKNPVKFTKNPARYVPTPANARRMRKELSERYTRAEGLLSESGFFPRSGDGPSGIVASGVAYAYVSQVIEELGIKDQVSLLKIGAYPIPERTLAPFLESVDSVLVVEELTPFVEDEVTLAAFRARRMISILGKRSGHLPFEFEYSPDLVEDAVRSATGLEPRSRPVISVPELPPRPPVLCPGCPHRTSFYLARRVFGKNRVYCNDIGCYTLGYGEPLESCDMLLCMGASITLASGIARATGERAVAYIGDSTFFHSGLPALADAVKNDDRITVIILNNFVTAMTGFQPSVASREDSLEPPPVDNRLGRGLSIERAVRGLGVERVFSVNQFDEESTLAAFREARAGEGVNVVICNAPCVVHETRLGTHRTHAPYEIDQELCNECSLCVRVLGCPGIYVKDGKYFIDPDLCDGCELCAHVCNLGAIKQVSRDG